MFKNSSVNEIMSSHGFCDAAVTAVLNDLRNKQSILQCHENWGNPACLVIRERSILQALFGQMMENYGTTGPSVSCDI